MKSRNGVWMIEQGRRQVNIFLGQQAFTQDCTKQILSQRCHAARVIHLEPAVFQPRTAQAACSSMQLPCPETRTSHAHPHPLPVRRALNELCLDTNALRCAIWDSVGMDYILGLSIALIFEEEWASWGDLFPTSCAETGFFGCHPRLSSGETSALDESSLVFISCLPSPVTFYLGLGQSRYPWIGWTVHACFICCSSSEFPRSCIWHSAVLGSRKFQVPPSS
jgi:hypothetical protein